MSNSKAFCRHEKPAKPRADYPMFAHPSGQWARKINKRLYYFGIWADPVAAEERHDKEYGYLKRGEIPPPIDVRDGCTVKKLADAFMDAKEAKVASGDFSQLTWNLYFKALKRLVDHFGRETRVEAIAPGHWTAYHAKLAKQFAPTSLRTEIAVITAMCNWGQRMRLHKMIDLGPDFVKPSVKALRKHRRLGGERLFAREEILTILGECDRQLRAMVLLALNCGFGNADVGYLEDTDLDLDGGWVTFSRVKTEVYRRIPLWPETVEALRDHLSRTRRPKDKAHSKRVFLTSRGEPFVRLKGKAFEDVLSRRFTRILKRLKINGRRGLGFYSLRHTHATVAGEAKDPDAVKATMGHVDSSVTAGYQHGISDERLKAVTTVVHDWLWPPAATTKVRLVRTIRGVAPKAEGGEA